MVDVAVFGEDLGHERVISALCGRIARDGGVAIRLRLYSNTGGAPRALEKLRQFVRDVRRGTLPRPDVLVVARDANCHGFAQVRREIEEACQELGGVLACAVPDPHVERWLLLDSAAFKAFFGRGCRAPDRKCDKDRYKDMLRAAIEAAGYPAVQGGTEYAADLVPRMDLAAAARDTSLGQFVDALRAALRRAD